MDNLEPKEEPKKGKIEKKYKKAGMVNWYLPAQLANTAVQVVISETLGRHSDRRIVQSLASTELPPDKPYHVVGGVWRFLDRLCLGRW